jgi:hypothetical protein
MEDMAQRDNLLNAVQLSYMIHHSIKENSMVWFKQSLKRTEAGGSWVDDMLGGQMKEITASNDIQYRFHQDPLCAGLQPLRLITRAEEAGV